MAISYKLNVEIIPGVSSLIPAITGSNMRIEQFYYFGWLSPKKDLRRQELFKLKKTNEIIVLMETPYRLKKILADVVNSFGKFVQICLAYELTNSNECFYRGSAQEILSIAEKKNLKGEFVLIIDNRKNR
jgi:16S rRNA (cytidine1402-2'-O)-methyltransferase